ncbi:hypothetical protein FA04_02940 [Ensifer adhaerens]|uniref:Uncharacterized protein n=1 Tax=Ensifer adhaerens TaxID=106592 RepID=A0ABY8HGU9_ENSAD|nr:hypothetical protein [Ensifer adhaerens]ANK71679.1 hypothetical protein FA04_02940 [Ensifer adhaerens]KDP72170.1 hypothetical protein FA04_20515 [Ensifer adhaerens]WFP91355.1 hypothetical protein P4B07_02960 [Ensifer adhaerens]
MPKRKKNKLKGPNSKLAKPFNPDSYRILNTGLRGKLKKARILEDTTADLSQYEDTRVPQVPGKTIHNPFKAYPWRPTPFNTVKG